MGVLVGVAGVAAAEVDEGGVVEAEDLTVVGWDALDLLEALRVVDADVTRPIATGYMLTIGRHSNTAQLLFKIFIIRRHGSLL